ncbi:MAG: threo-3-hydroxy-L-aspartate ammonia-lyase [Planctomycetota bacterium]
MDATPVEPAVEPDLSLVQAVTLEDVVDAASTIAPHVRRTPVMTSRTLDAMAGGTLLLKCESFQRVGAFKFRGACNALSRLPDGAAGVLAYSSGNHAQGVALASALLGVRAVIVMPSNAPDVKLAATRGYLERGGVDGSEVVLYDPETTVREMLGAELAEERGLVVIPPYDHPHIIAGQGTAALELIEDHGSLDALYVCCGGGGLLSGCAVAAKALHSGCRVVGVEPAMADDAAMSFRTGRLHAVRNPATIADGARTPSLGRYTFPLVRAHADDIVTVGEDAIRSAMRLAFERLKLVVEPAGALALAGVLRSDQHQRVRGKRVGVIVSGGNVDAEAFSAIVGG